MSKLSKNNYQKSTVGGRLYIPTNDFFKQVQVKKMIPILMKSSIYREIKERKQKQFVDEKVG